MKVNGEKIRELRWNLPHRLSIRQLGGIVGITRTQMSGIENGRSGTTRKHALAIARALGVKLRDIK